MTDELSKRYGGLLTGVYDCVDRIVLNAYFSVGTTRAGFECGGGACTTDPRSSWTTPI
jgi:hypothetical protein